jgi:hypothetical protein
MNRIVTNNDIALAMRTWRTGPIEHTSDADIHDVLDRAAELAEKAPGVRVTRMTIEVADEEQANAVRRYLRAGVTDARMIGDYYGIEVELVKVPR